MFRLIFFVLLVVNTVVFACSSDLFQNDDLSEKSQDIQTVNKEKIRIQSITLLEQSHDNDASSEEDAMPTKDCALYQISDTAKSQSFELILAQIVNTKQITRSKVESFNQYLVYVGPFKDHSEAQANMINIKKLWSGDSYAMMDDKFGLKHAVALGSFKTKESAQKHADAISSHGVSNVIIKGIGAAHSIDQFTIRQLSNKQKKDLESIDLAQNGAVKILCASLNTENE